jgi:S-DNA-T family DNA segregation ATPase FtsK/SpoIIIE
VPAGGRLAPEVANDRTAWRLRLTRRDGGWERRATVTNFCHVRVGVGTHRLASRLMVPETGPPEDLEPVSTVALRRFVSAHSVVHALPTAVSPRAFPTVSFEGDRNSCRQWVRSMIVELCAFHGPDHLQVAVVTSKPDNENPNWAKWPPQAEHTSAAMDTAACGCCSRRWNS